MNSHHVYIEKKENEKKIHFVYFHLKNLNNAVNISSMYTQARFEKHKASGALSKLAQPSFMGCFFT